MEIKEKTALITLGLNAVLTLFKFLLFLLTGSLAVLAEAWHSFSDIATSFLVYLAVRQGQAAPPSKTAGGAETEGERRASKISMEQLAALGIGGFLLLVAALLILKFFNAETAPVKNPLLAGGLFLSFALGSYLVYRFESAVGRQEGSVGLQSDAMHSRIDMLASFLTGFSLILYFLGLDLDRVVAGIIALFVLSFAVETIVNVALSIARREKKTLFQYKFHHILARALSPEGLAAAGRFLDRSLRIRFFGTEAMRRAPAWLAGLAAGFLACLWISTCTFTVGASEQAFVERFGKPLDPATPLNPGLHFKAPWPVDRAVKVETQAVRRMNIGNITEPSTFALLWTQKHGTEIPFLSGDDNYFYPYLVIHYRIKNLYDYLYRHVSAEQFLEDAAHQVLYKLCAGKPFFEIACEYRPRLVADFQSGIQALLDCGESQTGIEIVDVAIKDIHPPILIADAYEMVIASMHEKERTINEALGYRNQNLPETRGASERARKEAEAYALEMPLRARGDSEQFLLKIPEGGDVREITKRRLWLSTLEEALAKRRKVLVDPRAGRPDIWMDMRKAFGPEGESPKVRKIEPFEDFAAPRAEGRDRGMSP